MQYLLSCTTTVRCLDDASQAACANLAYGKYALCGAGNCNYCMGGLQSQEVEEEELREQKSRRFLQQVLQKLHRHYIFLRWITWLLKARLSSLVLLFSLTQRPCSVIPLCYTVLHKYIEIITR